VQSPLYDGFPVTWFMHMLSCNRINRPKYYINTLGTVHYTVTNISSVTVAAPSFQLLALGSRCFFVGRTRFKSHTQTKSHPKMPDLFIRQPSGKTITISCFESSATRIEEVKQKIFDMEGIPVESQRLIFCGSLLNNGKTLADYNIFEKIHNSTIHLIVKTT